MRSAYFFKCRRKLTCLGNTNVVRDQPQNTKFLNTNYQTDWTMSCYNDTNISTNELSETSRINSGLQLHPGFLQNLLRDLGIIRSNLQHLQNYTSVKIVDNGDRQLVKDINSHFDNFHVSHLVHFTIISIYHHCHHHHHNHYNIRLTASFPGKPG